MTNTINMTKQKFELYYYNCEESDHCMPLEVAEELGLTAQELDYCYKNFDVLVQVYIEGTLCEMCWRELPAPDRDDLGDGHSQLVTNCSCGMSYVSRAI